MSDGDPHNRKQRIRNTLQSIEESNKISEHNKEVALDFKKYLESQDLSLDRTSRYLYSLKTVLQEIDWKLDEPNKDNLIELVGDVNKSEYWDKDISHATKKEYKKLIRKLYADYLESKEENIDGDELTDFFTVTGKKKYADPEELPRPHHIAKIVKNCRNSRDKSFCMILWTAARIGAVLGLRWKDIRLHEDIAKIKFRDTKTGENRKIPAASAFPYLKQYKENDPLGNNPEAFVFRPLNSENPENQLSYNGAKGIVDRAVERTNIPEHILTNPHSWRKGRISELARKGFSEAQIALISGHNIASQEIRVYCRLASSDITSSIRQEAGLKVEEDEANKDILRPRKCPNKACNHLNKFENEYCSECGEAISTSELFKELKSQETEKEMRKEVIETETSLTNEEIKQKARNMVRDELNG